MSENDLICPGCEGETFYADYRQGGIALECVGCGFTGAAAREEYEAHAQA